MTDDDPLDLDALARRAAERRLRGERIRRDLERTAAEAEALLARLRERFDVDLKGPNDYDHER